MIKSKVLKIILFLAILFTAIFFICFFGLKYKETILTKLGIQIKQSSSSTPTSVFGSILKGADSEPVDNSNYLSPVSPGIAEKFKDDPNGYYFFRIGWDLQKVNATDPWDYTKSAFVADIVGYNADSEELKLKVTLPESMPYIGQTITTIAKCDSYRSYLVGVGQNVKPIKDLTVYFVPSRTLFTGQCSNEQCSEVGPFCKVSME